VSSFPHPSRPGFYGLILSEELRKALTVIATALLPGDGTYPSAAEAHVVRFIEQRASERDIEFLRQVIEGRELDSPEAGVSAVAELEREDPIAFAALRELVYHGYYASARVLATMTDRGYAYHGAPQPLGYAIVEEMAVPSTPRGSYIPTEGVARAAV
jgi:hypothetical protein